MKAQELRIGNLVTIDNQTYHPKMKGIIVNVISITKLEPLTSIMFPKSRNSVGLESDDRNTYSQVDEFIMPIPLTEEWLVKFGFKKTTAYHEIDKKVWILSKNVPLKMILAKCAKNTFDCYSDYSPAFIKSPFNYLTTNQGISSVHQLQNLYFALTGQELTA